MILDIPFELTQTEAENLDKLFYENRSVIKKINLLLESKDLSLDQGSYLTCLIVEDLIEADNYKGLNKLYNGLKAEELSLNVGLPLAQIFKKIEHNLTDTRNISHAFTKYLDSHNIAFEKI